MARSDCTVAVRGGEFGSGGIQTPVSQTQKVIGACGTVGARLYYYRTGLPVSNNGYYYTAWYYTTGQLASAQAASGYRAVTSYQYGDDAYDYTMVLSHSHDVEDYH